MGFARLFSLAALLDHEPHRLWISAERQFHIARVDNDHDGHVRGVQTLIVMMRLANYYHKFRKYEDFYNIIGEDMSAGSEGTGGTVKFFLERLVRGYLFRMPWPSFGSRRGQPEDGNTPSGADEATLCELVDEWLDLTRKSSTRFELVPDSAEGRALLGEYRQAWQEFFRRGGPGLDPLQHTPPIPRHRPIVGCNVAPRRRSASPPPDLERTIQPARDGDQHAGGGPLDQTRDMQPAPSRAPSRSPE